MTSFSCRPSGGAATETCWNGTRSLSSEISNRVSARTGRRRTSTTSCTIRTPSASTMTQRRRRGRPSVRRGRSADGRTTSSRRNGSRRRRPQRRSPGTGIGPTHEAAEVGEMTSAATSSRDLVRRSLQGSSTDRTPVIMHLGMYAPRLQQLTFHKVAHDPTLLANAVQSAQKLFGCDGVIPLIDTTLEAESCGCRVVWTEKDEPAVMSHPLADGTGGEGLGGEISSQPTGRLAVALEATQRLGTIMGRTVALLPAITGPVTIGQHLRGPGFLTELNQGEDAAADTLAIATRTTLDVARHYLDAEMEFLVVVD